MISFAVPDAEAQYLSPREAQGFRIEFFNFPRSSPARPIASRFGCEAGKGLDA